MTPHERCDRWMKAYVRAWKSDDPHAIGELFAAKAVYATGPFDRPWRGRAKIVAEWIALGDSKVRFRYRYKILSVSSAAARTKRPAGSARTWVGIIEGRTIYAPSRNLPEREYGNLWLVRLNERGEAEEFREWFMSKP